VGKVVTYANDAKRCFCQIRLDNGDRILISFASVPTASVKVMKLALGGMIPVQTVWEYTLAMAGGQ
jgi:hypothetical protein